MRTAALLGLKRSGRGAATEEEGTAGTHRVTTTTVFFFFLFLFWLVEPEPFDEAREPLARIRPCCFSSPTLLSFWNLLHTMDTPLLIFFASLGVLSLSRLSLSLLRNAYRYFLRRPKDLRSRYGAWALVTGSTDGIGRAIASELARAGLNLVLVGRNPEKLRNVSSKIAEERPGILLRSVVLDFSGDLRSGMRALREEIDGLDVGVLVNNAGMGTEYAKFFHERGAEVWAEMIKVNLEAPTEVAKAVLEGMVERRRGAVVNIGSGSSVAVASYPLHDVHAATKAYIDQFSKCLHLEYKDKGIDVQCQVPLFVDTKLIKTLEIDRSSIFTASAEGYARAAVRWIGYGAQCVPYFPHFIECCLYSILPASVQKYALLKENMAHRKAICTK